LELLGSNVSAEEARLLWHTKIPGDRLRNVYGRIQGLSIFGEIQIWFSEPEQVPYRDSAYVQQPSVKVDELLHKEADKFT
jgi:hypothetical protein